MIFRQQDLPGGLYLVATPIGTARDITLRALDILASADVLAAEDTRSLRHLMGLHGLAVGARPLIAYHDHSGAAERGRILGLLDAGKAVAYAAQAGTPLVADPGFRLVQAARQGGHAVTMAPGPSAAVMALALSGLPSDRFLFLGFLPTKAAARRAALGAAAGAGATLVIYESPKRVQALLSSLAEAYGPDCQIAVCRELTKKFEEIRRGTAATLLAALADAPPRGEHVLVVAPPVVPAASEDEIAAALRAALADHSLRDAAQLVADRFAVSRREAYRRALAMKPEQGAGN